MQLLIFISVLLCFSCSADDEGTTVVSTPTSEEPIDPTDPTDSDDTSDSLYFPPIGNNNWESLEPESLGWDEQALNELDTFLEETNTKAFIILKDGKVVVESYYQDTDVSTIHRWNSAAKTLTASVVGIAEEEGFLSIDESTSTFLGDGWTNMTQEQESQITIKNQLTMTTGGDYTVADTTCFDPECLLYLNDPDEEWYYHNAFYVLLQDVVSNAVNESFNNYFDEKIKQPTGMTGTWIPFGNFKLFFSNARSMARFGLLSLNQGTWQETEVIAPDFFTEMTTPSQNINEAYGYLWWLNGQDSFRIPSMLTTFSGSLIPTAPDDLIVGLGADDQKLYVVPSEGLVIVRLGDASNEAVAGPSSYDAQLWEKIMQVIQ